MEEEESKEEEVVAPKVWCVSMLYYHLKAVNYSDIQKNFMVVWRIQGTMKFKPLNNIFFIITFYIRRETTSL
jgi:hypothetical protein